MITSTTEGMPPGMTLIRYGLFSWGWKIESPEFHLSNQKMLTARGAQRYARAFYEELRQLSTPGLTEAALVKR